MRTVQKKPRKEASSIKKQTEYGVMQKFGSAKALEKFKEIPYQLKFQQVRGTKE
jgi:hypothetical protein